MKEKIKKILFAIAEIGTVIWAIRGMWQVVSFRFLIENERLTEAYSVGVDKGVNFFWLPFIFYFLSAILILYLLRKFQKQI